LRGNGPLTGYGYFLYTRPHFLHKDVYLRLIIPPGYFISEVVRDHWPSHNSAIGFGISGGLWADSQVEFRDVLSVCCVERRSRDASTVGS
jgi:hypothetical protein